MKPAPLAFFAVIKFINLTHENEKNIDKINRI